MADPHDKSTPRPARAPAPPRSSKGSDATVQTRGLKRPVRHKPGPKLKEIVRAEAKRRVEAFSGLAWNDYTKEFLAAVNEVQQSARLAVLALRKGANAVVAFCEKYPIEARAASVLIGRDRDHEFYRRAGLLNPFVLHAIHSTVIPLLRATTVFDDETTRVVHWDRRRGLFAMLGASDVGGKARLTDTQLAAVTILCGEWPSLSPDRHWSAAEVLGEEAKNIADARKRFEGRGTSRD